MIADELSGLSTKIIFVPSHRDIMHFETLPQAPFSNKSFNKLFGQAILVGNPDIVQLNDFKLGFINTDVLKDMCSNMVVKNLDSPKIDLSLQAMLEQRTFYPCYPPNSDVPIEYSQIEQMMMEEAPNILITPSDLTHFVKVSS